MAADARRQADSGEQCHNARVISVVGDGASLPTDCVINFHYFKWPLTDGMGSRKGPSSGNYLKWYTTRSGSDALTPP